MSRIPDLFLRAALVFFGIGVAMGVFMSGSQDFLLRPVHVHVNLLGWVCFFLYAAFYRLYPAAAATRLARAHFWSAVIGTPVMLTGLWFVIAGTTAALPLLLAGEALTVISVALFITVGWRATAARGRIALLRPAPAE